MGRVTTTESIMMLAGEWSRVHPSRATSPSLCISRPVRKVGEQNSCGWVACLNAFGVIRSCGTTTAEGVPDRQMVHAGQDVIRGQKWGLNIWVPGAHPWRRRRERLVLMGSVNRLPDFGKALQDRFGLTDVEERPGLDVPDGLSGLLANYARPRSHGTCDAVGRGGALAWGAMHAAVNSYADGPWALWLVRYNEVFVSTQGMENCCGWQLEGFAEAGLRAQLEAKFPGLPLEVEWYETPWQGLALSARVGAVLPREALLNQPLCGRRLLRPLVPWLREMHKLGLALDPGRSLATDARGGSLRARRYAPGPEKALMPNWRSRDILAEGVWFHPQFLSASECDALLKFCLKHHAPCCDPPPAHLQLLHGVAPALATFEARCEAVTGAWKAKELPAEIVHVRGGDARLWRLPEGAVDCRAVVGVLCWLSPGGGDLIFPAKPLLLREPLPNHVVLLMKQAEHGRAVRVRAVPGACVLWRTPELGGWHVECGSARPSWQVHRSRDVDEVPMSLQ